ncbi:MAG: TonB family protein [Bacteroidales bacterium]|nr:TonB family protein [Bacteroidales bacterium]MDD7137791.1 TonB family protein [Bacteroidales bacterium]MDY5447496.1 TonB family protein [Sodaliphilus sp.]
MRQVLILLLLILSLSGYSKDYIVPFSGNSEKSLTVFVNGESVNCVLSETQNYVCLSYSDFLGLEVAGKVSAKDFHSYAYESINGGSIKKYPRFFIKELKISDAVLQDVEALVVEDGSFKKSVFGLQAIKNKIFYTIWENLLILSDERTPSKESDFGISAQNVEGQLSDERTPSKESDFDISAQNVEGQLGGLVADFSLIDSNKRTEIDSDKVFSSVEEMPKFPGGDEALLKYVGMHLNYPKEALRNNVQGKCILKFVVTKIGTIGKIKIVRSLSQECDEEAKRVVRTLPEFFPGRQNGRPVNVWYTLPVNFRLSKE